MKHFIPMMAIIALFFVSCSDRNGASLSSLDGYTFVNETVYQGYTVIGTIEFGKPHRTMATISRTYEGDKKPGGIESPDEYYYTLNGTLLTFKYTSPGQTDCVACYMTYRNDSIYSGSAVFHRK